MAQATTKIEDYAFLSDTQTGALVSRDGCVDWLCFPRFDSPACFASLLGDKENGHWRFFPKEKVEATRRRYREETLILETEIETRSGAVRLIDFMPRAARTWISSASLKVCAAKCPCRWN
jgi:GH15 family glucan-1,4-alpha-glucosidase